MTLSFLLYFFGTCSCTPSELPDSRRLFGTRKFLPLSLFNELPCAFRSGFRCASRLLKYPRFRKGLQRYAFFLYLQIFSQVFFDFFCKLFLPSTHPEALTDYITRHYETVPKNEIFQQKFPPEAITPPTEKIFDFNTTLQLCKEQRKPIRMFPADRI